MSQRNVVLGITGSIAAYKAADLASRMPLTLPIRTSFAFTVSPLERNRTAITAMRCVKR
ncbi:MAG: hypothetical protein NTZ28_12985 [Nitrospirae bacterium]|nr:hypothetical protein [Nitrospirota bacterium]